MSDQDNERSSPRVVAQDAMFTVRRLEKLAEGPSPEDGPTFCQTQGLRYLALELDFTSNDWPPFSGRVFVDPSDEKAWGPVPQEWEEHWAAEGVDPRLETSPPAPLRIERGTQFILRRVEPLTPEYWLIREALAIREVLDAPSVDDALAAAHALGALREQAHLHGLHLESVRVGRNSLRGSDKGASRRRGTMTDSTRKRLRGMEEHVQGGKGVSLAADLVAKLKGQGWGTPGSNRHLWYAYHPKQKKV